jgi:hypothetical protein
MQVAVPLLTLVALLPAIPWTPRSSRPTAGSQARSTGVRAEGRVPNRSNSSATLPMRSTIPMDLVSCSVERQERRRGAPVPWRASGRTVLPWAWDARRRARANNNAARCNSGKGRLSHPRRHMRQHQAAAVAAVGATIADAAAAGIAAAEAAAPLAADGAAVAVAAGSDTGAIEQARLQDVLFSRSVAFPHFI